METITDNLHATTLAKRLQGVARDDFWLHLESEGPLEKYPGEVVDSECLVVVTDGFLKRSNMHDGCEITCR